MISNWQEYMRKAHNKQNALYCKQKKAGRRHAQGSGTNNENNDTGTVDICIGLLRTWQLDVYHIPNKEMDTITQLHS